MCYIVLIRIRYDRLIATTYLTNWRERWRQRFTYKTITLYYTLKKVNNLYSDNSLANSSSYFGSTPEQEDVIKMKNQAYNQSLNQETQECKYTIKFVEELEKIIH